MIKIETHSWYNVINDMGMMKIMLSITSANKCYHRYNGKIMMMIIKMMMMMIWHDDDNNNNDDDNNNNDDDDDDSDDAWYDLPIGNCVNTLAFKKAN